VPRIGREDAFSTARFVRTDDLLKKFPERAPWRPAINITPELSGAELLTLAVMQALLGFVSESRLLRYAANPCKGRSPACLASLGTASWPLGFAVADAKAEEGQVLLAILDDTESAAGSACSQGLRKATT
jgi:hypothetical protein